MNRPIRTIESTTVVLAEEGIDTDRIIPARFLTTTERAGLGAALFADRRGPNFPLDRPEAKSARILVAGADFGCGSSREHAVWALVGAGFEAVVAPSFGDIFRQNALQNGLVPVALPRGLWADLAASSRLVSIDVARRDIRWEGQPPTPFPLDPWARYRLLEGVDDFSYLLGAQDDIAAFERRQGRQA